MSCDIALHAGGPVLVTGDGGSRCPAWCAEQAAHAGPGSYVHRSAEREVPVTRHWWCLDMRELGADLRCTAGGTIAVFLTMADGDGVTEIVLQHGDMELPHVSLDAARDLARYLTDLARAGR